MTSAAPTVKQGHPKGLYVLFFAEAWERFSYYGMRALLVLYLVNQLKFDRKDALAIYGVYTGLVYLTPILGGVLADRVLGKRKAVLIGGLVMALGHLAMAFEPLLYLALGLLIIGNGFFKPNISTIVGGLYEKGDPRRDGGFTIFYMGINLGAFLAPLVCGTLGEKIGWHYGFGAAGVGMMFGLAVFVWGQKFLGGQGFAPGVNVTPETRLGARDYLDIVLYTAASVGLTLLAVYVINPIWKDLPGLVQLLLAGTLLFAAVFGPGLLDKAKGGTEAPAAFTRVEWQRIAVIGILTFFVIFFWMGFEQAGGTMTLFADTQTDRHLFGWEIPASYFQAINPLLIVALAPFFSMMWTKIDQSRFALPTAAKMGVGMIILGLGFIVMFIGQKRADEIGLVGPLWLAAVYALHTVGELCLSPIGLSMVTKLSPARIVSMMMGLWYTSSAIANYLAGTLEAVVERYHLPLYGFLVGSSIGAGILVLLLTPLLKKWTNGAEELSTTEPAPPRGGTQTVSDAA